MIKIKGIITTIVITIIFLFVFLLYAFGIISPMVDTNIPRIFIILIIIGFCSLIGALIVTMIKRIKELKEENKDDISKY